MVILTPLLNALNYNLEEINTYIVHYLRYSLSLLPIIMKIFSYAITGYTIRKYNF